ncbi:CG14455 [Drosophila busckii]|uniref:CG14455 n=1 Tax=Drosophila busckii TaxID=30019 RepID=A0A0M4F2E8_DROBS|nr:uncharacterized protein LOC108598032 [Drosophila busckii]ALC43513.1 CG14455 [Drosophila busckii]ALC45245.1 CG14455 [Drosophila busckii]
MRALLNLIFILLISLPLICSWRSFKILMTRFDYEANPKFIDVKIELKNTSDTSMNVVLNTYETVDNLELSATVGLLTDKGNYMTFMNRTTNFCKLLKHLGSDPLVRVVWQDLVRHGKMFKECPIIKGQYTLQDYRVDEELLPSFLPETSFKFSLGLNTSKHELIFNGVLYGRVDKSKGFNNLKSFSLG